MRYAFVAEHRDQFQVRSMCRCLRIQPSGFYAWRKSPLSQRARDDARQTELIRQAWNGSGKVYGYRKLHNDLLDQGERCCSNRVARLTRLAGIRRKSATSAGLARMGEDRLRISEVLDTHFAKSWTSVSQSPGQLTRFGRGCLVKFQTVMISAFSPWVKRDGARVLRMLSPSRAMR